MQDIEIPEILPTVGKERLSHRSDVVYRLAVTYFQWKRRLQWWRERKTFARERQEELLPFRVHKHTSLLFRRLGDTDPTLQKNKVKNLALAIDCLDGLLIGPGESFSFCRLVGKPTKKRGFVDGLQLSRGEAISGTGGGICQIANLIHWLVLHSPLEVTERSQHSFDPFPDEGRVIPFGTGAAIFYNYVDYCFHNPSEHTFQLRLWLTEKTLEGEIRSSIDLPDKYRIKEKNHAFLKIDGRFYRTNEIWQYRRIKTRSEIIGEKMITKNFALVKYAPKEFIEVD